MRNINLFVLSAAIAASLMNTTAMAEVTANADITTNYVWRGVTQTDDSFALQGGVDWADKSGFSAGAWASNVDFVYDSGIEYDIYGGYEGKANQFTYNLGLIRYDYTGITADAVTEVYFGGGTGPISATVYFTLSPSNNDSNYITASYEAEVQGFGIKPYIGIWGGDADGMHFGVEGSKNFNGFDLSATIDVSDKDLADDTYLFVMAKKTFQL